MARYCLVENGAVIDTILWDGSTPVTLKPGVTAVLESSATALPRFVAPVTPEQANEAALNGRLDTNLAQLQAYRTVDSTGLTVAQRLNQLETIAKLLCGVAIWIIRLRHGKFDAND